MVKFTKATRWCFAPVPLMIATCLEAVIRVSTIRTFLRVRSLFTVPA